MSYRGRVAAIKAQSRKQSPSNPLDNQPRINYYDAARAVASAQCKIAYGPVGVPQNRRLRSWEQVSSPECFASLVDVSGGYRPEEIQAHRDARRLIQQIEATLAEDFREAATFGFEATSA